VITTADFKTGLIIELDGDLYQIMKVDHIKPGRGAAVVKAKLRNIRTGSTSEKTFRSGERVERAIVERREATYLYTDGAGYYFQDAETFDEAELTGEQIGDLAGWLKEGENVVIARYEGALIGVEVPQTVIRQVVRADPGLRGDTATGGTKPATIEGGVIVQVPLFISEGEVVKVDTRSGAYVERAN
jgi:elongation factor P